MVDLEIGVNLISSQEACARNARVRTITWAVDGTNEQVQSVLTVNTPDPQTFRGTSTGRARFCAPGGIGYSVSARSKTGQGKVSGTIPRDLIIEPNPPIIPIDPITQPPIVPIDPITQPPIR